MYFLQYTVPLYLLILSTLILVFSCQGFSHEVVVRATRVRVPGMAFGLASDLRLVRQDGNRTSKCLQYSSSPVGGRMFPSRSASVLTMGG